MIVGLVAAAEAAPEELSVIANVMKAPPLPFVPVEQHGKPVVMARMAYAGDAEAGERAIASIRALAAPLAGRVRPIRYPEIYGKGPRPALDGGTNVLVDGLAPRGRGRRSSSTSGPPPPRYPSSSSACSAARWRASPTTPRRSAAAGGGWW